jgi:hypothetical protein
MADHKFKIGQMVFYHPRRGIVPVDAPTRLPYQITARLPPMNGEFPYRIKSANEQHERVAREIELRAVQQCDDALRQHTIK